MRGVVLLALGNVHYGRMAANLASSIRFSDKEVNIHLIYSGGSIKHLTEAHRALFTSISECPSEYYTKNGKTVYLKAKTCIYDLTPFDETIMIDVDLIWGKRKISDLFDELKDVDFTMQNRGYLDLSKETNPHYSMWCNVEEVKKVYQTDGRFYQLASEFIYFKKSDENKKYFDLVKEIFENPQVDTIIKKNGKVISTHFGGDIPDELAFDIASCVLKKYPHKDNFVPVYWFATEPKMDMNEINKKYFGYSIGGSILPPLVIQRYTQMSNFYARAANVLHYTISHKRNWLPERRLI